MPTPVDIRVTPSLYAEIVREVDCYNEQTHPYVAPVMEAFDDAYITLGKIFDARDHASRNQAWTEGQKILNVSEVAYRQQQRLLKKFDGLVATMDKQINGMDEMLSGPLQQKAGMGTLNTEIREHVRRMPMDKRHEFVNQAVERKDVTTLTALLGAPAYLSGMLDAEHTHFTRKYHEMQHPEVVQRLTALRGAKALVEARGPLLMPEVQRAMGADWRRVNELRQGNDKALAALKFSE